MDMDKIRTYASLRDADLRYANLHGANLGGADLSYADLRYANLRYANLHVADLRYASLCGADLSYANLCCAILHGTNLYNASLRGAILPDFQIPQHGDITGWKALGNYRIAKIIIPDGVKRTANLVSRKCRAEASIVSVIIDKYGHWQDVGIGWRDSMFEYKTGEWVYPHNYNDDIRLECADGIHFFLTLKEAIEWR